MTWRPGDDPYDRDFNPTDDDEDDAPVPMPWRAAAPSSHAANAKPVLVEAWDDELPAPGAADKVAAGAARVRTAIGPATLHVLNMLAFALAVIGALAGLGVAVMHVVNDPLADARAYYEAASRLNAGQPLYPAGIDPNGNRIYLYPPMLAVLLRPLALLPFEAFALLWELVVVASFVALLRYLGVRRRSTWIAIGMLGVPIGWALTVAQAHVPMTLLLALGQPWSIAVATNLKLTPALIAIWWLGRRDWEAFFAFVVWTVLIAGAQLLLEPGGSLAYFSSLPVDRVGPLRNLSPFPHSPALWFALVCLAALITLALARTRWGWAAAVTLATLSPPRLLLYMLMGLLAALRQPRVAGEPDPSDLSDPVAVYAKATR